MKKHKLWICLIIMLGIIFIPFFAGCKNEETTIVLKTPISVNYKINEGSGKQIIFTEENPCASAYVFGICESDTGIDNFSRFEVKETDVNGKLKNYLDVTNLFLNTKTYYFYAQYIGEGKYQDSGISEINSVTIYKKFESPFLAINNTTLSWSKITNANHR